MEGIGVALLGLLVAIRKEELEIWLVMSGWVVMTHEALKMAVVGDSVVEGHKNGRQSQHGRQSQLRKFLHFLNF
jgi:hypothetical protein